MSVAAHRHAVQPDRSVKRVLVYRLGSLGDTLVAMPSLHLIAQAFPNAERRMLTNFPVAARAPAAAAVLGNSGLIHSYESYPVGTRNPLVLLALLRRLRSYRPQVAIYLKAETSDRHKERDRNFLKLTGARQVIGWRGRASEQARHLPDGTWEPEAQRLLRGIAELGNVDLDDANVWNLQLNSSEVSRAEQVLQPLGSRPFFAVSVGTKVQSKNWGEANWTVLLRSIAKLYPGHGLLLAGAPEERASSERVLAGWRSVAACGPAVNVCGDLSPRESAAAFRQARAFLGHDSGPMHLAAAVGVPTVSIFAARNQPRTWFPYGAQNEVLYHRVDCWGCGLETCVEQRKKCILSITAYEVMTALGKVLKSGEASQYVA